MADGISSFSQSAQQAKYKAGMKGPNYFNDPNPPPPMEIVDADPPEVNQMLQAEPTPKGTPLDPWVYRK